MTSQPAEPTGKSMVKTGCDSEDVRKFVERDLMALIVYQRRTEAGDAFQVIFAIKTRR